MQGWIKLHRKVLENDLWNDITTFRLFLLLLLRATHKDGVKIKSISLKRGQYLRSYSRLVEDLEYKEKRGLKKVSKSTVLRSVKKLIEAGMVSVYETKYGTLFTITKYEEYQGSENDRELLSATSKAAFENAIETLSVQEQELENDKNSKKEITLTTLENPIQFFEALLCRLSPIQMSALYQWIDNFKGNEEIINEAIKLADKKNKRNFNFVEFLLKEWYSKNLKEIDCVRAYERERFNHTKVKPFARKDKRIVRKEMLPSWFNDDEQHTKNTLSSCTDKEQMNEFERLMQLRKNSGC